MVKRGQFTVTISAKDCPYSTFKEFKEFATRYAGDTYWVAVQLLLERSKRLELYESESIDSGVKEYLHTGAFLPEEAEPEPEPERPRLVGLSGLTEKE